ncbi:hypothetical protein HNQ56_000811 [Anaerotaenia torta]|uniref:DUF4314 domain-containing protein n=1 Tax=Anaerotaenia torta TaxID=433293 RepID=UPI003D239FD7
MKIIHPEMLKQLKEYYTPGTRVVLIQMDDPYTNLQPGDKGTVTSVDDIGTIHVKWDRGSSLGVVFGEDSCRKIKD